jgi:hypothetical protein
MSGCAVTRGLRHLFACASVVAAVALFAGCSSDNTPKEATAGSDIKWVAFSHPDGLYSTEFPGEAVATVRVEHAGYGDYTMHYNGFRTNSLDIEVGNADISELLAKHKPEDVVHVFRDGIGNMFGTKNIVVSKPVTDGHEGIDYQIDLPDTTFPPNTAGHFRVYLIGNQVYQLVAIGNNSLVKGPSAKHFFDAFHFGKNAAGKPETKDAASDKKKPALRPDAQPLIPR